MSFAVFERHKGGYPLIAEITGNQFLPKKFCAKTMAAIIT